MSDETTQLQYALSRRHGVIVIVIVKITGHSVIVIVIDLLTSRSNSNRKTHYVILSVTANIMRRQLLKMRHLT